MKRYDLKRFGFEGGEKRDFVFDREKGLVYQAVVSKNIDFDRKYFQMFDLDGEKYIVLNAYRMSADAWKNKEAREEILFEFNLGIEEEMSSLEAWI